VLREELDLIEGIDIIGEAENGSQALRAIVELEPDLVFLDLQMPVMSGFELIQHLGDIKLPAIIIVTAFDEYAIQAFESGAIDYLLKPVRQERLIKSIERAKRLLGKPRALANEVARIASAGGAARPAPIQKLVSRMGREYFLVAVPDVLALQAEGELVWIVTEKRKFLATERLHALESRLPGSFQRVHRNAIVNVNHVRRIAPLTSNRWLMTLFNDMEFVVSKRRAHSIRRILRGDDLPVRD